MLRPSQPGLAASIAVTLAVCVILASLDSVALAQTAGKRPFGVGDAIPVGAEAPGGLVAWLLTKQAEYTRAMIAALRATRDGAGAWALMTIAFAYGVFHAAGPGHGKAVVASYVFANEQAVRRGIGVAFAAATLQAVVAIALVLPAILLFGATARHLDEGVRWIEIASFTAIFLLGASLTYKKLRALRHVVVERRLAALAPASSRFSAQDPSVACMSGDPGHVHGPGCSHAHLPEASELTGARTWHDLAAVTFAAGARPCSGAIILLAFALSVGSTFAGIAAVFAMAAGTALTTSGFAVAAVAAKGTALHLAERTERLALVTATLELVAAILVALLGLFLLLGYLTTG